MVIRRFDVISVGKIAAIIAAAFGLIFALLFLLFGGMFGAIAQAQGGGALPFAGMGLLAVVVMPVMYGIFGFVGMLIGVPLFAVISSLIGGLVQGRLSKKKMSIDSEDYTNLAKVSEKTDGFAYEKMKDPTHK